MLTLEKFMFRNNLVRELLSLGSFNEYKLYELRIAKDVLTKGVRLCLVDLSMVTF